MKMTPRMIKGTAAACLLAALSTCLPARAGDPPAGANGKRMKAVSLPGDQVSIRRDGVELTRLNFGPNLHRPFLFPVTGPSGNPLTRRAGDGGHPHHNSIWIAHPRINGVDFWTNEGTGRIIQQKLENVSDGDTSASITTLIHWDDTSKNETLLVEHRSYTFQSLDKGEWMLLIDSQFEAVTDVSFGIAQHGILGVRFVDTFKLEAGGTRLVSNGVIDQKSISGKGVRWADETGRATANDNAPLEGIAIFNHPANPDYSSCFRVYNGWMSTELTVARPVALPKGGTLRLCYGVYIHGDRPASAIEARWQAFAASNPDELAAPENPLKTLEEKP